MHYSEKITLRAKKGDQAQGPSQILCHLQIVLQISASFALSPSGIGFFSTKYHMYYAVIRAILGDNYNMPAMKTGSPGSPGLLLKGTAWLYNYHSDWQGEGEGERAAGEEIFSIWMNRSAALDAMLSWPSWGSCDIMFHSHTVSKISCCLQREFLLTPLWNICQFPLSWRLLISLHHSTGGFCGVKMLKEHNFNS